MGLKLKSIGVDQQKVNDGDWKDITDWPGVSVLVRGINYKPYQDARETALKNLSKKLGRVPLDSEFAPEVARLAAEHLLLGWKGLDGDDEKPLDYTPELAMQQMCDPEMSPLVGQVLAASYRVGQREAEFTANAIKN